jgi:hypothetical protein
VRAAAQAVPAYVPQALGRLTHDVVCSYPGGPDEEPVTEFVPCCGLVEADAVVASKKQRGATDIRVVRRGGAA